MSAVACGIQQRALDSLELKEAVTLQCECWELNLGPSKSSKLF